MYTKEQLECIFIRTGLRYTLDIIPDFETLSAVQCGFQYNIPYENLDIIMKKPLSLDYNDLYEKIITNHRGGYCFEINGFLGEVLRSLGYEVTEYMARYLRGETEIPMRRHRVLGVTASNGKKYICDAGIGQSAFRIPLPMEEGAVSEQFGETYKVTKDEFFGWVISDLHHGEWRRFYGFTEEIQLNKDYVMPSFWCENSPESPFTSCEMFSIKTEQGRITLDSNILHIFEGDKCTEKYLDENEVEKAYKYFGLEYNPVIAVKVKRYTQVEQK